MVVVAVVAALDSTSTPIPIPAARRRPSLLTLPPLTTEEAVVEWGDALIGLAEVGVGAPPPAAAADRDDDGDGDGIDDAVGAFGGVRNSRADDDDDADSELNGVATVASGEGLADPNPMALAPLPSPPPPPPLPPDDSPLPDDSDSPLPPNDSPPMCSFPWAAGGGDGAAGVAAAAVTGAVPHRVCLKCCSVRLCDRRRGLMGERTAGEPPARLPLRGVRGVPSRDVEGEPLEEGGEAEGPLLLR